MMLLRCLKAISAISVQQKVCSTVLTGGPRFDKITLLCPVSRILLYTADRRYTSVISPSGPDMASKTPFDFEARYLKKGMTNKSNEADSFFCRYDADRKGYLDQKDFSNLVGTLFAHNGKCHDLTTDQKQALFDQLDKDKTGKISQAEFKNHWHKWFKVILDPVSALLVVDVQNDFISGSLALSDCPAQQKGEEVVPVINKLLDNVHFDHVIFTRDWHTPNHISFVENKHLWKVAPSSQLKAEDAKVFDTVIFDVEPHVEQVLWPTHCIKDTEGAALHSGLKVPEKAIIFNKGMCDEADFYSAFTDLSQTRDTSLADDLKKLNVTHVYTCGLTYDYCVAASTYDAVRFGFKTVLIEDATRGTRDDLIENTKKKLKRLSVPIVYSDEVADIVSGKNRLPELALQQPVVI